MFGRGTGTITVIEEPVMRNYRRTAKIVFYITWPVIGLLAATVAASRWHPVLALLAGLAFGLAVAAVAGAVVAAWPVLRAIWWWLPETVLIAGLISGWAELMYAVPTLILRLACVAVITGVPAALRPVRSRINAVTWCLIARHRLRTCFSEFIITNRTGSLPLILWARPTPVGERVWLWLRPGLSLDDLLSRLDKIAVACWASAAVADTASRSSAAFVRVDIKRRDILGGTITSPLLDLLRSGPPAASQDTQEAPAALDLPEVPASEVMPARLTPVKPPGTPKMPAPASAPAMSAADGSDISDYI
jgi:hypothetical protein